MAAQSEFHPERVKVRGTGASRRISSERRPPHRFLDSAFGLARNDRPFFLSERKLRRSDRWLAWGVSPRFSMRFSRQPQRGDRLRLRREPQSSRPNICRPSGALFFLSTIPWGSHPRLNIFRRSAALLALSGFYNRPRRTSCSDRPGARTASSSDEAKYVRSNRFRPSSASSNHVVTEKPAPASMIP